MKLVPRWAWCCLVAALLTAYPHPVVLVGLTSPALPGLAGVTMGYPTDYPQIDARLRGWYLNLYGAMYANPSAYVGVHHWGDRITVEVPPGTDAEKLLGRAVMDVPGIEVVVSNRSSAARLMQIQDEVFDKIPEANGAGIDWKRHQVVVGVTDAWVDVRWRAWRLYGDDIILEWPSPQAVAV